MADEVQRLSERNMQLEQMISAVRSENSEHLSKALARSALLESEMQQINARLFAERVQFNQERISSVKQIMSFPFHTFTFVIFNC